MRHAPSSGSTPALLLPLVLVSLLLLGCEEHQYLAIPRAMAQENIKENISQRPAHVVPAPTVTVVAGNLNLEAGKSVTVHVTLGATTDLQWSQLALMAMNLEGLVSGFWEFELSAEELAAGAADLEVFALNEQPKKEWCQRDYRGLGTCYQEVDEGVTGLTVVPATETAAGYPGASIPISLPPAKSGADDCSSFTLQDCCGGSAGISAVACYIAPPCGCPAGTTTGGPQGDGTTSCMCP